ncbi:Hypothetical protein POVR2_LOCUS53 [uncultured virus]|nr:Hypothetical protein POVR2_LOCUS53 [uncultured virus]
MNKTRDIDELSSSMPGSRQDSGRIQSQNILLMYNNIHLPSRDYKIWLRNLIATFSCDTVQISVYNKRYDIEGIECLCSYVMLLLTKSLSTRRQNIFTWKKCAPEVRSLKNAFQIELALEYLDNWNYQYEPIEDAIIAEPEQCAKIDSVSQTTWPETIMSILLPVLLATKVPGRTIVLTTYCSQDDFSFFVHKLFSVDSKIAMQDILTISHVPRSYDLVQLLNQARLQDSWTGKYLVMDFTHSNIDNVAYRQLEKLIVTDPACQILIFASSILVEAIGYCSWTRLTYRIHNQRLELMSEQQLRDQFLQRVQY